MESFGNAKTLRNNNSSRFGKLISINFDGTGSIRGGSIIEYLLEKSRIVFQTQGERNYHIFYQLLAGGEANLSLKSHLGLDLPETFHYLDQSGVTVIDGVNDEKEFEDISNAMDVLNFGEEEKTEIFSIVAATLHLGNVGFDVVVNTTSEDGSKVSNEDVSARAAQLLQVDNQRLCTVLTSRNIGNRTKILVAYGIAEAANARDAIAKSIYARLFSRIIKRINVTLATAGPTEDHMINVLDIFGFESFETNSFEQLCINYCNEKLQFHFNEHIFRLEQEVYAAEGVHVPDTDFKDNQPTLDLLESKTGIFRSIDDEISVPQGSDDTFLSKLKAQYTNKHPNFAVPKPRQCKDAISCFGVVHYAGTVFYNVTDFLEKNRDSLHPDIMGMLRQSGSDFIKAMYPDESGEPGEKTGRVRRRQGKKAVKTLGGQFRASLESLMKTLNSTFPHFVRCMKPNDQKIGNKFMSQMMLDQLRYAGLLEVCRIRKLGFPVRRGFEEFFKRYRPLYPAAKNFDDILFHLTHDEDNKLKPGQWAKGHSKMFMKNEQAAELDQAREEAFIAVARKCQRIIRGFIWRTKYRIWRNTLTLLAQAKQDRKLEALEHWLLMSEELPHKGAHLPLVKQSRALMQRLKEEKEIEEMMVQAAKANDIQQLRSAVAAAANMNPPLESPVVAEMKEVLVKMEKEEALKLELVHAAGARDRAKLEELLIQAEDMGMEDCEELRQAQALKQRLDEEEEVLAALRAAIQARDLTQLSAYLSKCSEMGLNVPEIEEGRRLQQSLQAEASARSAISTAAAALDLVTLEAALEKAMALGLTADNCAEVAQGRQTVINLNEMKTTKVELAAASESRDRAALEVAIDKGEKLGMTGSEIATARRLMEALAQEEACIRRLEEATKNGDVDALTDALSQAASLGITGPAVDAANAKAAEKGSASALTVQLQQAASGAYATSDANASLQELRNAIVEAEKSGQGGTPEAITAKAARDRLLEDISIAQGLEQAIVTQNFETLSRLMPKLQERSMPHKPAFRDISARANETYERLHDKHMALSALRVATLAKDPASLEAAIAQAQDCGVTAVDYEMEDAMLALEAAKNYSRINDGLSDAVAASDFDTMRQLLEEADRLEIDGDGVLLARVIMERERSVAETMEALRKGSEERDLQKLNEALESTIALGLTGPQITAAHELRDKLTIEENAQGGVIAAMRTMELKAQSPGGISPGDIQPLVEAISEAKANGVPDDTSKMRAGRDLVVQMEKQIQVQNELDSALRSKNRNALKDALDKAEDMELQLASQDEVKQMLKELDAQYRAQQEEEDLDTIPLDEAEAERLKQERLERQRRAANPKFNFRNFNGLRSPDDFARGVVLNKKKVKEGMLKWQNTLISKSLLELDTNMQKLAVQVHKALLGYMGDKQMSFPATLAQDILQKGLENIPLRNEIYCQVMKQLSSNPKPESIAKGWQMMCMCVSTFPPTIDFENYLLNFILKKVESRGAVKNYAKYCLRALEGMLTSGASGFVPSVEEIQAYKERPPILATVELVDGMVLTEDLPVTPDLNVQKVLEICTHFLDLSDPRADTMGIFVYDIENDDPNQEDPFANMPYADLPRTPRPLRNEDYLGDVLVQKARQRRNFKFVYKRKIALPQQAGPSADPMYNRLIYLQAEDDLISTGNLLVTSEEHVAELAALSIAVAMPDEGFPRSVDALVNIDVPEFIPPNWRHTKSAEEWAQLILGGASRVGANAPDADLDDLQLKLIHVASQHPYYGAHWFYCHRVNDQPEIVAAMPRDLVIGFNADGMHILDAGEGRAALATFGYADIYRWGGSSSQFSLIIWDAEVESTFELILTTAQAADMAAIILDYINAIMAATGVN
eukprot:scaffold1311_cov256-Pinguiococcus_pyrenoidosus.AAC.38